MFLESFLRRRQLRRCVRRVGPRLIARYGPEKYYSPNQIRVTLDAAGVSQKMLKFACAMYASRDDFAEWFRKSNKELAQSKSGWSRPRSSRQRSTMDHAELYERLRAEAAAVNGGSRQFLPVTDSRCDDLGRGPPMSNAMGRAQHLNNFRWYD